MPITFHLKENNNLLLLKETPVIIVTILIWNHLIYFAVVVFQALCLVLCTHSLTLFLQQPHKVTIPI